MTSLERERKEKEKERAIMVLMNSSKDKLLILILLSLWIRDAINIYMSYFSSSIWHYPQSTHTLCLYVLQVPHWPLSSTWIIVHRSYCQRALPSSTHCLAVCIRSHTPMLFNYSAFSLGYGCAFHSLGPMTM